MNALLHWVLLVFVIYPANSLLPNITSDESSGRDYSDTSNVFYESCLTDPTYPCIQKRIVNFLDRLSKVKAFSILGDWLFVIKVNETSHNITEKSEGRMESEHSSNLIEKSLERFFNSHIIRLTLPDGIKAKVNGESRDFGTSLDISLGRAIGEARKKMKMKHMMSMMMSGLMSKAAMMGPLLMMIVKIKAFKALLLSTLALVLSKIQLFKMLMKGKGNSKEVIILHENHGGGGHGGGWSSGGESWSSAGSEGHDNYVPPNDNGMGYGGGIHGGHGAGFGGGGGGWSSGGGGHGGGAGSWASASGDSYSGGDGGGHGGGGGGWGSGWASRNYDPTWLVYRANKTDTKQIKRP